MVLTVLGNSDEQGGILISHWEVGYCSAPWVLAGAPRAVVVGLGCVCCQP